MQHEIIVIVMQGADTHVLIILSTVIQTNSLCQVVAFPMFSEKSVMTAA